MSALRQIEKAETRLRAHGFEDVRVRYHGSLARVEVPRDEVGRLQALWPEIEPELVECGFEEVQLNPDGYRRGGAG